MNPAKMPEITRENSRGVHRLMKIYAAVYGSDVDTPRIELYQDEELANQRIEGLRAEIMGLTQPPSDDQWHEWIDRANNIWSDFDGYYAYVEEFDVPITVYAAVEQVEWDASCEFYSDKKTALDDVAKTREKWLLQHPHIDDWQDEPDREHVWYQLRPDLDEIVAVELVEGELR